MIYILYNLNSVCQCSFPSCHLNILFDFCNIQALTVFAIFKACAGIPVVPFLDLDGTGGGSLRNVDDGAAQVNLSSPPLLFGIATFTTAYVSAYLMIVTL